MSVTLCAGLHTQIHLSSATATFIHCESQNRHTQKKNANCLMALLLIVIGGALMFYCHENGFLRLHRESNRETRGVIAGVWIRLSCFCFLNSKRKCMLMSGVFYQFYCCYSFKLFILYLHNQLNEQMDLSLKRTNNKLIAEF